LFIAAIVGLVSSTVIVPNNIALVNYIKVVIIVFVNHVIFVYNVVPVLNNVLVADNSLLFAAIKNLPVNRFWAIWRHVVTPVEKFHVNISLNKFRLFTFYAVQGFLLQLDINPVGVYDVNNEVMGERLG